MAQLLPLLCPALLRLNCCLCFAATQRQSTSPRLLFLSASRLTVASCPPSSRLVLQRSSSGPPPRVWLLASLRPGAVRLFARESINQLPPACVCAPEPSPSQSKSPLCCRVSTASAAEKSRLPPQTALDGGSIRDGSLGNQETPDLTGQSLVTFDLYIRPVTIRYSLHHTSSNPLSFLLRSRSYQTQ